MIQLYSPGNTVYEKNGDIVLQPASMVLHCVLNGEWTAELVHPMDEDGRWIYIVENAVVKCPSFLPDDQLYRIKAVSKNDSEVTADLEPVFLDAIGDCWISDIRPTGKTGQQALNDMLSPNSKYSGSSDILTIATAYWQNMNAVEALNGDIEQSFINRWGGEIVYNNFELIVNQRAGADHGVSVRYGKNLPVDGMEYTVDMSDVTTRLYPQGYNGREMTNHGHVDSEHINDYPTVFSKSITFDDVRFAEDVSDTDDTEGLIICQTQAELDTALTQKCEEQYEQGADLPRVTIKVDMVLLQNTENYADVSNLESVSLGDDVQCINANLGINTKSRVVELEYDACGKCVTNVTIGELEPSYFNNVTSSTQRIDSVTTPAGDLIAERVQGTLNAIKTQLRLQSTVAEKVDGVAFLIEDLDPDSAMYGAMEGGTQGLRVADERTADGTDWDWRTAITAKGIVADLIASGTLRAIDIEGVNITGSTITGTTITGTTINGSNINGSTIKFGDDQKNITFEKDDAHDRLNIYGSDDIDINSLGQIRIISSYTYDLGGARSYLSLYNTFKLWNDQYQSAELRTYPSQQSTGVPASLYGNSYMNVHNSVLNVDGVNSSYYGFDIVSMIGGRNCSIHGQTNSDTNKGSYVLINGGSRQFRIGDYFNNDYTMYADGHKMIGLSATDQINFFLGGTNILSARNDGRLYARNGVTYGTVVVGRDTHSYSISWDGSHAYLWVDVTRVGQIV